MSQTVEQIISAKWVIPVSRDGQKSNTILSEYSVVVDKGIILELVPTAEVLSKYTTDHHFQLTDHALIPGLVNIHTHAAMSLFKGLADDLPLMIWLENHIWPAERQWVSDEFCEDGLKLAIAEMIRCGTTTFNDMYFQPNMTAKVAHKLGMRVTVGMLMFDFPSVWGNGPEDYLKKGLQLRDDYKHHDMIQFAFAPHAPYTVSDEPLKKISTLSNELGIPVHMHIHETAHEVKEALKTTGKRPIKRLQELGLMTPNLIAVHMTQLQRGEMELLAQNGVSVAHCPQSNMKLASGICPVQELMTAGVNIAIGTDGNASNNDLNMLAEMKSAALLGKVFTGSAQACSAHDILHAATYGGAKALGQEHTIGSIEVGKAADLTAINLNTLESQPVYDPVSQIVYTAGREQVTHVWINGAIKLNNQQLVGIDIDEVIQRANHWKNVIQGQV